MFGDLATVYICKKMTGTGIEHAGVMVLVEADTNRAEGEAGAFLASLNPIVYPTREVLPRTQEGWEYRQTHPTTIPGTSGVVSPFSRPSLGSNGFRGFDKSV